jgi:DNA repair photolyase
VIETIITKKALNKIKSDYLPYKWDLNVYRGCSHHCQYCYALYSHKYLEDKNFYNNIYVKANIAEALEKQLASKRWKHEVVNLGGVTDNYQPIESEYKLMPQVLKLMIKYKTPITISTKSDLILRDMDLLCQLAKVTSVNVAVTVTTLDENIRQKIEPGAVPSIRRLNALKQLSNKNIGLGLHLMPILPKITDSYENIESIFSEVSKIPVDYAICAFLNLKSETKKNFLEFIKREFPEFYPDYLKMYPGAFLDKNYRQEIYEKLIILKEKYKINNNYHKNLPKDTEAKQLGFWS